MRAMKHYSAAVILTAALTGQAAGQLLPPPGPSEKRPAIELPPTIADREAERQRELAELRRQNAPAEVRAVPIGANAQGELQKITARTPQRAALDHNTAIDRAKKPEIEAVLLERRRRMERVVINDIDLLLPLSRERLARVNLLEDIDAMGELGQMIERFVPETELHAQLLESGIIEPLAFNLNNELVREYNERVARAMDESEDALVDFVRDQFAEATREAFAAYEGLLVEAALRPGAVERALGGQAELPGSFFEDLEALGLRRTTDADQIEAGARRVRSLLEGVDPLDIALLLDAVLETRPANEAPLVAPWSPVEPGEGGGRVFEVRRR